MSEELKNIDIIYRKELRDFPQSAPEDVWDNIEQELILHKKKRNLTFYRIAAAIVSITLIGSIYLYLSNENKIENLPVAENQTSNEKIIKSVVEEKVEVNAIEEEILTEEIESNKINHKTYLAENKNIIVEEKAVEEKNNTRDNYNFSRLEPYMISIAFEKKESEIIDTRIKKVDSFTNSIPDINNVLAIDVFSDQEIKKDSRWAMGGEFSPLYSYRHISEADRGSDKEMFDDVENSVVSYSGGLNFQFKAKKRLTVQFGVYYSTMGQALDYMSVYENSAFSLIPEEFQDRYMNNYSLENSSGGIVVNSEYIFVDDRAERISNLTNSRSKVDISNPVFNDLNAEIEQNFQYIEVPFLLRYTLIDKLVDVNFVGGFGANFLIGNKVYLAYGDAKEKIGYTEGVRDVNYNGTIGLGFEYPLMERLNIRFEPSIKYYLNEINPTSQVDSHPYSIGFYTGINYSF